MPFDGRFRICFVCSGNICRSPMAEVVLRHRAEAEGLADLVAIDSAGIGDWHIGERADHRALAVLRDVGYDGASHRARQFDRAWFERLDLVIALDRGHERSLLALADRDEDRAKVRLLRSFDPSVATPVVGQPLIEDEHGVSVLDVRDPYYIGGDAFLEVLEQVEAACEGLLDQVRASMLGSGAAAAARPA